VKAGLNGVLNMSILDGWFDEADDAAGGWAIGDREPYSPERDEAHAAGIYSALENEIVPLYYERDQGVPEEWMRRVKQSLRSLSANFNCQRMVDEYRAQLYDPAHRAFQVILDGRFESVRERIRWSRGVVESWPRVRFTACSIDAETVSTGLPVALRVADWDAVIAMLNEANLPKGDKAANLRFLAADVVYASVAFRVIFAFSSLEIGQPALAFSTASSNAVLFAFGILTVVSR